MLHNLLVGHGLLILGYAISIAGIIHMLSHRRSPASTIAWLLVFISLPFLGTAFYLVFGGRKLRARKRAAKPLCDKTPPDFHDASATVAWTLQSYGAPLPTSGNRVKLCRNGVEGFRELTELIEGARDSIHLMTFIFSRDRLGQEVVERLAERARAGVTVRVLVDGLGSLKTPRHFFLPLIEAGGEFAVFQPVSYFPLHLTTNLRNHRKVLVVDGVRSFSGGMNITGEELYETQAPGHWHDISLAIEGPAAEQLNAVFCEDWHTATGTTIESKSTRSPNTTVESGERVQLLSSGPDFPNDPIYAASITAIYRATERIWIATPYFVPNDGLVEALVFACQRDVDVRILIPARSNHPISDLAAASLLRDVQAAGGKVFRYPLAMLHAKAMIVDHKVAAVGSANFDMRSLFLNYEIMQVCYSPKTVNTIAAWFTELAAASKTDSQANGWARGIAEGAVRVLSPMF